MEVYCFFSHIILKIIPVLIAFVAFVEVLEVLCDPGSTVMPASILAAVQ